MLPMAVHHVVVVRTVAVVLFVLAAVHFRAVPGVVCVVRFGVPDR